MILAWQKNLDIKPFFFINIDIWNGDTKHIHCMGDAKDIYYMRNDLSTW